MLIQIILLIFIFFVFLRIISKAKRKEITLRETFFWVVFWLLVTGAVVFPRTTDIFAQKLGVGRGADLLVYLAVIFLFYLVFRVFVQLEKIEKDITKIIREIALRKK
jgi:hypothetical protein